MKARRRRTAVGVAGFLSACAPGPVGFPTARDFATGPSSDDSAAAVDSGSPDQGARAARETPSVSPPRSPQGWNAEKGLSVGRELLLPPRSPAGPNREIVVDEEGFAPL